MQSSLMLRLAMVGLPLAAGCTHMQGDARLKEAADLASQRVGILPDWKAACDTEPPWGPDALLSCEEAIGAALRNNRELRADLEMIGMADADLLQAGLLQNPVINLMLMFPDGGGRSMLRGSGLPMMPLQDLWMIPTRQKIARAALQGAVLRVADRAVATATTVKRTYTRLQYTQRAVELLRDNLGVVEQSMHIISTRQSAGKATQVQVNLTQIRGLKLRSELMTMEADHRTSQLELLTLMGLAGASATWRVEPISELKGEVAPPLEEKVLLQTALQQRLDVLSAQWETQSAHENIRLARREGWPDLGLGLSMERAAAPRSNNQSLAGTAGNALAMRGSNELVGMMPPVGAPIEPFMPKERMMKWTIGPMLEMEIPIFDYGQGKVARAKSEYRQKHAMYEAKVQEVTRMVRDRLVMLRQAFEQVQFYRTEVTPAVERNLDVARRSFISGMDDLTTYLEVQEDLLMTRLKILEFYRDYMINRADLEREVGGSFALVSSTTSQPATQPDSALNY